MRELLFAIMLLPLGAPWVHGQAAGLVTGKVRDAKTNDYLIGANIRWQKGGAITRADGAFRLSLPAGDHQLYISYIGYEADTQRVAIGAGDTARLNILLRPRSTLLEAATITSGKYRKPLNEVTVSLEVLPPRLIENTNKNFADDALQKVPGVQVIDGQANIRGGSGYSYGAGSRVLLLLDDIPILQADAGFPNWDDIPVENIEQIEVVKGAASALYGSSALNGIINIQTSYPGPEPETEFTLFNNLFLAPQDERNQWWDSPPYELGVEIVHRQRYEKFDLTAGSRYYRQRNYNQDANKEIGRFHVNTRYRPNDNLYIGLNGNLNFGERQNWFYWKSDTAAYQPPINAEGERLNFTRSERFRLRLDPFLTYYDKVGNRHRFLGRFYRVDNDVTNNRANASNQYYAEYQFQRRFRRAGLLATAGLVAQGSEATAELYGDTTFTSRNYAGYFQLECKFFDRLTLSAGFRYENNVLKNPTFEYFGGEITASEEQESKPVLRLGLNYKMAEATFLRASWGQGYRFPTVLEKFIITDVGGFFVAPNPTLGSETGWSTELAVKQGFRLGAFEGFVDLALFWMEYDNMIEFNLLRLRDLNALAFQATNVGGTRTRGIELSASGRGDIWGLPTTFLFGYTYLDPRFEDFDNTPLRPGVEATVGQINANNSSADEDILKYRFRHTLKLDWETEIQRFSVGAEGFYNSEIEAIDAIFNLIIPGVRSFRENHRGYFLLNLRTAYRFSEQLKTSLFLNNTFNTEYAPRPGLLGAPRNIGLRLDYQF